MKNFNYKVKKTIFSGDMHTPVSIYLKVRDLFPLSALLECTDYHSDQNSCSYIALCTIAAVSINNYSVKYKLPDSSNIEKEIDANYNVEQSIN